MIAPTRIEWWLDGVGRVVLDADGVTVFAARPAYGAPVQHGWQCTCGDYEVFSGACSI